MSLLHYIVLISCIILHNVNYKLDCTKISHIEIQCCDGLFNFMVHLSGTLSTFCYKPFLILLLTPSFFCLSLTTFSFSKLRFFFYLFLWSLFIIQRMHSSPDESLTRNDSGTTTSPQPPPLNHIFSFSCKG